MSSLLKKLLSVQGVTVKSVEFEKQRSSAETLFVEVIPHKRHRNRCPICRKKMPYYDEGRGLRSWRSLDLGTTKVYLKALAPRVDCSEHGVRVSFVPWARRDSWFTREFEETVTWLTLHASRVVVSHMMRIAWESVGSIVSRVYADLDADAPGRFDNLVRIGIDETSYRKGHKYLTAVVNHDTNRVIWVSDKHGKEVLAQFFKTLTEEQRASIRCVSADGARWITVCIEEYCPNAKRCIDPFHVVSWATEALDSIRKDIWREAYAEAKRSKPNRGRGRPTGGSSPHPEGIAAKSIKGARYALLKNPENLTENQSATIALIANSNKKLYRAYQLKEQLRLLFQLPSSCVAKELERWIKAARYSRIPQFVELQRKIVRHQEAIRASIEEKLSNARVEAINNKIKLCIRMAYGFRNIDNLIAMIMLKCSGLPIVLPGRG